MKTTKKEITITAEQRKAIETVMNLSNEIANEIGIFGGWAYGEKHIGPITDRHHLQILVHMLEEVADIEYVTSETI